MLYNQKPWYKDWILYPGLLTALGIILIIFSFIKKIPMVSVTVLTVFTTLLGILTYYMWETRCPKCGNYFTKKEDKGKEKDLGTRKIKREFYTKIIKRKDGTTFKEQKGSILWPARFAQRFYYCKSCGYGKNYEWSEGLEGHFKFWEKQKEWEEFLEKNKPKIVYLKEEQEKNIIALRKTKKEETSNKLVSIIDLLKSQSYPDVRDEEEFEKIVKKVLESKKYKVTRQKSKGGFKPDILVDDKYPIELKLIENNTKPLQTLTGQIEDYKKIYKEVGVLILVSEKSKIIEHVSNKIREFNKKPGVVAEKIVSEIRRKNKQN